MGGRLLLCYFTKHWLLGNSWLQKTSSYEGTSIWNFSTDLSFPCRRCSYFSPKKELLIFLDLETTHSVFLESYLRLWNCSTPRDVWCRLSLMFEDGYIRDGVCSWMREPSIFPKIICHLLLALACSFPCLHELLYCKISRESTKGRLSVLRNTYKTCLTIWWYFGELPLGKVFVKNN